MSLWSYDISDPTLNQSVSASIDIKNSAGTFGAYLSGFLADMFGFASYVWVLFFFAMGLGFIAKWFTIPWHSMLGYIILFVCLITVSEAFTIGIGDVVGGGILGAWLYSLFHVYFNPVGSAFIWMFLLMIGFELCFHVSWVNFFSKVFSSSLKQSKNVAKKLPKSLPKGFGLPSVSLSSSKKKGTLTLDVKATSSKDVTNSKDKVISADDASNDSKADKENTDKKSSSTDKEIELSSRDPLGFSSKKLSFDNDYDDADDADDEYDEYEDYEDYGDDDDGEENAKGDASKNSPSNSSKNSSSNSSSNSSKSDNNSADSSNSKSQTDKKSTSSKEDTPKKEEKKKGFWSSVFFSDEPKEEKSSEKVSKDIHLPSIDLLSPIPAEEGMPSRESLDAKGESLMQCLLDFNVQGRLAGILPGPVVTMFEVRPERGVKAKRFEVLSKDIAMAIKAIAVRVQAPIPGTDTVGIEVPNDTRQVVSFREIIQSEAFTKSDSVLSLGLGKDIFGKPMCGKMEEMPHLLVAGATGAGKSVCLNSIILSILYKARPHEVKMLLIDPKRVELAMYADLPHLVHPVVTDMDLAKNALLWAIDEMDQRYQLFQNNKVRNFTEYNSLVKKSAKEKADADEESSSEKTGDSVNLDNKSDAKNSDSADTKKSYSNKSDDSKNTQDEKRPLPYIVIIIDELADLMMQKGKEVEASIVRLAQLARAAGIHLIIATQRPSVDVVTGLIKANFPSRIAFQVTSGIDSRTILDTVGAEALLGKGDMLFKPRAGALQRMHGAFVTDDEVRAVVDFWKQGKKVEYTIDFTQYGAQATESAFADRDDAHDPMFDAILERIVEMDEVSISMLQRHFKLGFGRAGRIMDQLERDGIVGPPSGSKPRKVLH